MPFETKVLGDFQTAFLTAVTTGSPPETPGLRVHYDTWLLGLIACLEDIYPAVALGLGCAFKAFARDYVKVHPQMSGDRAAYGAGFGDFLEAHPHLGDLVWLPDLARYEHAVHCAETADDALPCDFETLLDPDLSLDLHPSVAKLQVGHDVASAHEAILSGADPGIVPGMRWLLIGRTQRDEVVRLELAAHETDLLNALACERSLFALITRLNPTPDALAQWQTLLAKLVHNGFLIESKGTDHD